MSKLAVLSSLLNLKFEGDEDVSDHFAKLETKSSRLAAMNDELSELMQVVILVASSSYISQ